MRASEAGGEAAENHSVVWLYGGTIKGETSWKEACPVVPIRAGAFDGEMYILFSRRGGFGVAGPSRRTQIRPHLRLPSYRPFTVSSTASTAVQLLYSAAICDQQPGLGTFHSHRGFGRRRVRQIILLF